MSLWGLGHVPAYDLIHIIKRNILQADGPEGGLSILWLLFDVRPLSLLGQRVHQGT